GNGGKITLSADRLELRDGGRVTTGTNGPGNAGSIEARARVIAISGVDPATGKNTPAFFSGSNTSAGGPGGNISLYAGDTLSMSDHGEISTSSTAAGGGAAGDIAVRAGRWLVMDDSSITTSAFDSSGGNVRIAVGGAVYLEDSTIRTNVS